MPQFANDKSRVEPRLSTPAATTVAAGNILENKPHRRKVMAVKTVFTRLLVVSLSHAMTSVEKPFFANSAVYMYRGNASHAPDHLLNHYRDFSLRMQRPLYSASSRKSPYCEDGIRRGLREPPCEDAAAERNGGFL